MGQKKRLKKPLKARQGALSSHEETPPAPGVTVPWIRRIGVDGRIAMAVSLFGLLLRLLNLVAMHGNSPFYDMPSTDSDFFHTLALRMAGGDWLGDEVFYYNPLYPHVLGAIYALFGPSFTLVKIIQAVMGSVSSAFLYFIALRLFDRRAAAVAGAVNAAYAPLIFMDELLLSESLGHFLLTGTILFLLRAVQRSTIGRFAAAGLLLGLGFLTRPSVLPFVAVLWLLYAMRRESRAVVITRVALFGMVATLTIATATLRNWVVGDDFVLVSSHTGYNFHLGNNEESNGYLIMPKSAPRTETDHPTDQRDYFTRVAEADIGRKITPSEMSRYWTRKGLRFIQEHPVAWLGLEWQKFIRLFNEFEFSDNQSYYFSQQYSFVLRLPLVGFGLICPLGLLGLVLCARSWSRLSLLYLAFFGNSLSLLLFFTGSRYRMIIVPFLILFSARALVWIIETLKARNFPGLLKAAVPLGLFLLLAFQPIPGNSKDPHFIDYYNLGNKLLNKKQYNEAIEAYRKSIDINPDYLSSQNNLASAYSQAGRWRDARSQWEKVLRLAEQKGSERHIKRAKGSLKMIEKRL